MIAYSLLIIIWIHLPIITFVSPSGYQSCSIEMCKSTPELGSRGAVAAVGPSHGNQGNDCRANEKIGAGRAVHDYRWWRDWGESAHYNITAISRHHPLTRNLAPHLLAYPNFTPETFSDSFWFGLKWDFGGTITMARINKPDPCGRTNGIGAHSLAVLNLHKFDFHLQILKSMNRTKIVAFWSNSIWQPSETACFSLRESHQLVPIWLHQYLLKHNFTQQ